MYLEGSIQKYLADLAAKLPAPGGGSAAALAAAAGVSLMSMVANYTVGNPKYKDVEEAAASLLLKLENANNRLQALIDEDVKAYGELSKGMKEHKKDAAKLELVYKKAAEPPFEICRISGECLTLCRKLVEIGNKNLITDTAIAAVFLEGAFVAAKYNVYINLKCIKDMKFIEQTHKVLSPLEGTVAKLKEEILEKCEEVVAK